MCAVDPRDNAEVLSMSKQRVACILAVAGLLGTYSCVCQASVIFKTSLDNSIEGRFSNGTASAEGQRIATQFVLDRDAIVTDVHWWGYYESEPTSSPSVDTFRIRFYADALTGVAPGTQIYEQEVSATLTDTTLNQTYGSNSNLTVWEFSADPVPPLALHAGSSYWIEVMNVSLTGLPGFLWSRSTTTGNVTGRTNDIESWTANGGTQVSAFYLTGSIPEPHVLTLLGLGLAGLSFSRRLTH